MGSIRSQVFTNLLIISVCSVFKCTAPYLKTPRIVVDSLPKGPQSSRKLFSQKQDQIKLSSKFHDKKPNPTNDYYQVSYYTNQALQQAPNQKFQSNNSNSNKILIAPIIQKILKFRFFPILTRYCTTAYHYMSHLVRHTGPRWVLSAVRWRFPRRAFEPLLLSYLKARRSKDVTFLIF